MFHNLKAYIWDRNEHNFKLYPVCIKLKILEQNYFWWIFAGHRVLSDTFFGISMQCAADVAPSQSPVLEISAVLFFCFTVKNKKIWVVEDGKSACSFLNC